MAVNQQLISLDGKIKELTDLVKGLLDAMQGLQEEVQGLKGLARQSDACMTCEILEKCLFCQKK